MSDKMVDLNNVDDVEVVVSSDNKTLWVNVDNRCRLRVQKINGKIILTRSHNQYVFGHPEKEPKQ